MDIGVAVGKHALMQLMKCICGNLFVMQHLGLNQWVLLSVQVVTLPERFTVVAIRM